VLKIAVSSSLSARSFDEIAALIQKIAQLETSLAEVLFDQVQLVFDKMFMFVRISLLLETECRDSLTAFAIPTPHLRKY